LHSLSLVKTFLIILHTRCISIVSSSHFKSFPPLLLLLLLLLYRSRRQVQKDACITYLFYFWRNSSQWATASSFMRFLDHTQRRTTVGRTPMDERSACRRELWHTTLTTDIHDPGGIRTHLSRRAAADLRLRLPCITHYNRKMTLGWRIRKPRCCTAAYKPEGNHFSQTRTSSHRTYCVTPSRQHIS